MALLSSKRLFAGALFAGALFASQQIEPPAQRSPGGFYVYRKPEWRKPDEVVVLAVAKSSEAEGTVARPVVIVSAQAVAYESDDDKASGKLVKDMLQVSRQDDEMFLLM